MWTKMDDEDLLEGFDDEDDLNSEDERAIEKFLGEKEKEKEIDHSDASESELALLAAKFLNKSVSVQSQSDEERRRQKKIARRKRHRERQKEERKHSKLESTAYVRSFGDDTFSKDELLTLFPHAQIRLSGEIINGRSRQAFVQVDSAEAMSKVLSFHRKKIGVTKLSVRAALTHAGLESLVTTREKKKRKISSTQNIIKKGKQLHASAMDKKKPAFVPSSIKEKKKKRRKMTGRTT